jgi:hypothetical protein
VKDILNYTPPRSRRRAHLDVSLQCDDYCDEDQLEPSERNKGDMNGERHLDERRRARELIAANDEREDRHRERSKPSKDENGGTVGSGNEGEDITR